MRKTLLFTTMLLVATSVWAFGGLLGRSSSGRNATEYKGGVSSIGVHINGEGKADIQTLAPGVSGALLTTVLGLVVAIPSVVGYNIITSRIKSTIVHLDNFVEEFIVKLKIENLNEQENRTTGGES